MKDIMKALCEKFELDQNKVSSLTVTFDAEPFGAGITTAKVELIHLEDEATPDVEETPEQSPMQKLRQQYTNGEISFQEFRRQTHRPSD